MSIAQEVRIKELERQVAELSEQCAKWDRIALDVIADLQKRLTALENRPKPGRPPKNG